MAARMPQALRAHYARARATVPPRAGAQRSLSTSPFRPTRPMLLQVTEPTQMLSVPVLAGVGLIGAGVIARMMMRPSSGSGKWVKGGFQAKMDRKEAAQILGLRESSVTRSRIKDAHRRMMIANHPDRGGSPYIASKINEAKDILDRNTSR
ncbi:mitochondrial import inner membrane translocase subunit TIM14 [Malassezia sp. CBS 17886]|nr:mitochondrial import inner membrane translocase subunit TIM14 [Malassezia sp. CBS 17886]